MPAYQEPVAHLETDSVLCALPHGAEREVLDVSIKGEGEWLKRVRRPRSAGARWC